jgi:sigma-E factor negative regulatory protein RseB
VVEVHHQGALLERIYLDTETGLLLERDQFDVQGAVVRALAFESLTIGHALAPPADPPSKAHHAPKAVAPERLGRSAVAPGALADGYRRTGVYRDGSVLHVLYSDGMYDLSVFQQPGRLRRSDVPPSGERVAVGRATAWRFPWAGGQLVVWSSGGKVFTAVSDAPADQVLAAVRSLPAPPTRELSLMGKVRRACEALMEPLG